ncbi:MAK10-like protein [Tanacetum coccineum]
MGDANPIRTLEDYSKPSHEGYRNTIELPIGNNVVPHRSDTIRLVQNGCSFYGLQSEDPNQHLKDFLKLVDSLDLDGSITTWEDLTTHFLAQFFPSGRTAKLRNDIRMFQQHHEESLSEAWTHFKELPQKLPHYGIDLWLQDLAIYDNKSWNDPRDFAKPVKAISLPQDVLMNKITTSCEICSGPYDTQYCMEDPEQAFVEYASSRIDKAGGKWYTFKPEQNNLGDTYNPSWKSHPYLRWRQPQNSQDNFSNLPNRFQPNSLIPNRSFNNHPQSFNNQSNLKGLVSSFMASQDARLSKFEADFKQQQSEMTNKIDTVLKGESYNDKPEENGEGEKDNPKNIHVNPSVPPDLSISFITEKVLKLNSFYESLGLVPQSSNIELVCTKGDDDNVMFIKIVKTNDDSHKKEPEDGEQDVEYFDIFPTRSELAYHKYLMCGPIPSIFLRNPIITEGCPSNLKIPCNIGHVHVEKAYIDLNSPLNIMTRMMYNWTMRRKLDPRENSDRGVSNFTGRIKGMHVFVGNFTFVADFMIVEDISSIIDPRISQVVLGKPFVDISNMTHDPPEGVVRFTNGTDEIAYKMPHKIEQYNSMSDLEKEHTKSVYLRKEEDKRRGVEYKNA